MQNLGQKLHLDAHDSSMLQPLGKLAGPISQNQTRSIFWQEYAINLTWPYINQVTCDSCNLVTYARYQEWGHN